MNVALHPTIDWVGAREARVGRARIAGFEIAQPQRVNHRVTRVVFLALSFAFTAASTTGCSSNDPLTSGVDGSTGATGGAPGYGAGVGGGSGGGSGGRSGGGGSGGGGSGGGSDTADAGGSAAGAAGTTGSGGGSAGRGDTTGAGGITGSTGGAGRAGTTGAGNTAGSCDSKAGASGTTGAGGGGAGGGGTTGAGNTTGSCGGAGGASGNRGYGGSAAGASGNGGSGGGGTAGTGGLAGTGGGTGGGYGDLLHFTAGVITTASNRFGITGGAYTSHDGVGSTISPDCQGGTCFADLAGTGICVTGTVTRVLNDINQVPDYATYWGAAVALDLNNPTNSANARLAYKASYYGVIGFSVAYGNRTPTTVPFRMTYKVRDPGTGAIVDYCAELAPSTSTGISTTVHFSDAKQSCDLGTPGPALTAAMADHMEAIQWQVPTSVAADVSFDYCVFNITPITQ
jgi:hypothetical protein